MKNILMGIILLIIYLVSTPILLVIDPLILISIYIGECLFNDTRRARKHFKENFKGSAWCLESHVLILKDIKKVFKGDTVG